MANLAPQDRIWIHKGRPILRRPADDPSREWTPAAEQVRLLGISVAVYSGSRVRQLDLRGSSRNYHRVGSRHRVAQLGQILAKGHSQNIVRPVPLIVLARD